MKVEKTSSTLQCPQCHTWTSWLTMSTLSTHQTSLSIRLFFLAGVGEGSNRQRKAWHKGLYCGLPPPHSVTNISVRISQSELFPAVMSTLHKFLRASQRWLFLISSEFPRIFAQFYSKMFTQGMESVSTQCRCLPKLLTKRFLMFCVNTGSWTMK